MRRDSTTFLRLNILEIEIGYLKKIIRVGGSITSFLVRLGAC